MKKKKTISRILAVLIATVMAVCFVPQMGALVFAADAKHVHDDGIFYPWTETNSLPEDGNYYLTKDVALSSTWSPDGTVNLCLNDHSITFTGKDIVISPKEYVSLNLYDCGTTTRYYFIDSEGLGHIADSANDKDYKDAGKKGSFKGGYITGGTGNDVSFGGGIYIISGATVTMNGGNIIGNSAGFKGGGVFVDGGTFNMNGGSIIGNSATYHGGGVCVSDGTFNMYGGTISGNSAKNEGGGVCVSGGTFNMYGGTISGNSAENNGGGVHYYKGMFNMYGGTIAGNSAGFYGGGVHVFEKTFNMSSGTISGNSALVSGGGVCVSGEKFTMTGGTIKDNSSECYGGGVYCFNDSVFQLSGSPRITSNKADGKTNNIRLGSDNKVIISGEMDTPAGTSGPQIGVTMVSPGVFTSGLSGKLPEEKTITDVFFSDDAAYDVVETSEHEAQLVPVNGSLKLTKLVTVNGEATEGTLTDGTYEFTIKGPGADGKVSKKVTITITNGKAASATVDSQAADLDSDGYVEVADLKAGEYVITETAPTNGTSLVGNNNRTVTVEAGKSGANVGKGAKADFTNNINVTEIEVDKAWVNADGSAYWPEGVTVEIQLTADGEAVAGKTDTLSAEKPSCKFESLPKYRADGTTEIVYSVEEVEVPGYTSTVSDLSDGKITITNTWETTDVEVEKKWTNADGTDAWPEGVTVDIQLTAGGEAVAGKTDSLSAEKPSCKFESLPKYRADGTTEIQYSVKEVEVPGYESTVSDLSDGKITITNTWETTQLEVEKKWTNADGTDTWPEGVTVDIQLTADGKAVQGKTATLSAAKPSCKFESLPKYQADGTTEIVYGIEEGNVPNGYMSKAGKITDGKITVTNTCKAKVIVTVTKDDEAVSGMAAYLTLKDGEGTEYKNLFVYDNGSYVYDPSRKGAQQLSNGDYDLSFEAPGYLDASLGITYVEDVADIKTTFDYYTVSIEKDPAQSQLMDVQIAGEGKAPEPSGKVAARNKDKLTIKTTVKDGYHFDGYSVLGTAPVWEPDKAEQTIGVQGTAEIMAHAEANVYTVHFDPNKAGCTGTMEDQDMVYDQPQQLYANQFTCAGTTFAGWNTKADGSGIPYKDGERVSNLTAEDGGKVTLYAQWTVKPAINKKQVKISLDAGLNGTSSKGKVTAAWGIAKDADYYEVYATYCGEDSVYKKIKTVNGKISKLDIKRLAGKKLNPKRSVKYYVVAYKTVDGKKVKLARSLTVHVVGSGNAGKSNIKAIQVTKKNYTLKKGKTAKIKAKLVLYQKGKKTLDHERKFRYATSNDKVATVSKNGKIKAVGKGKCDIYVYAQNGCAKKIKVTVK